MKKLLILLIFIVLLAPVASATKNVTYITSSATASQCSDLTGDDKWFCERLEDEIGYDVTLVHENQVRDGTSIWKTPASKSDLIFFGVISQAMIDGSKTDSTKFCSNVTAYTGSGKAKVFGTFLSIYNDTSSGKQLTGCALGILGLSSSYSNNICSNSGYSGFKKNKTGYPTDSLGSSPVLLSPKRTVYVHGTAGQGVGWVSVVCNTPPTGALAGEYSVVNNTSTGAFWGLTDTASFTSSTKNFFDRMVWYILDDTTWAMSGKTIPASPTINESMILVSKITLRGSPVSSGTVNYTIDQNGGVTGNLAYNSASTWWEKYNVKLPYAVTSKYNITGYSGSTLMGHTNNDFDVGNLTVTINSGDYMTNSTYTINATVSGIASSAMNYKIWNKTSYTTISTGAVDSCSGATCTRIVNTNNFDEDTLILEVTVQNGTLSGGSYKLISTTGASSLDIQTDDDEYRPGDTIDVDVYTTGVANTMKLSVIDPLGSELLENSSMTQSSTDDTHWYKSYTLGEGVENGTYEIEVYSNGDSPIIESEEVDVIAWIIAPSLDKSVYSSGDTVEISVTTTKVHTDLNFTIKINLTDPDDDVTIVEDGFLFPGEIPDASSNGTFSTDYNLSNTAIGGEYSVNIYINDSYDREFEETLEFTVGSTSLLQVTPSSWEVSTTEGGYFTKEFTVKNIGNETLENFTIYESGDLGAYLDTSEDNISSISEGASKKFNGFMTLNTGGTKAGTITIENSKTKYVINVTGTYLANATKPNEIFVAPSTMSVVLPINKKLEKSFALTTISTDGVKNIAPSITGDIFGIVLIKSAPSNITIAESGTMVIETNTQAKEIGTYTGSIEIASSAGTAKINSITIDIIPDLSVEARARKVELEDLQQNITKLKSRRKNVTEIESLYNTTNILLDEAATRYEEADYDTSKIKYELALSNINSIETKINTLETAQEPAADYSGIIWIVAILVVVIIAGIMIYKNKDKIKQFLQDKGSHRKKDQPKEERKEYYEPVGEQGGYRTDYY
ncbi:MAG: hypothetical protein GOV02_04105 [Candidatus Aenigmarchaeota archaeon]|nr:hypothetical protein [Candidatus Aenigmarchaeota archaeon]